MGVVAIRQNLVHWICFLVALLFVGYSQYRNPTKVSGFERNLIAPPPAVKSLHFGFNEVIADILWIRTLQDFDYCESKISEKTCKGNSWLYQMLDTCLTLSPHFHLAAVNGGVALSVLVSDFVGATKFFDLAVSAFPNDWQVLYYAAYHAMREDKNNEKAAGYLIRAARNGGKDWFFNLAVTLYTEAGQQEFGRRVYESLKDSDFEPGFLRRMEKKLGITPPPLEN